MVDRLTYTPPSYVGASSTIANLDTGQPVVGNNYQSLAVAEALPVQNQAKDAATAVAGSNTQLQLAVGQPAYVLHRNTELNTPISTASAAYGKTLAENTMNEKLLKRLGVKECQTCKERRYQDVSNDAGVSFKTPTHVAPENAGAAVAAHEQEHVRNEQANAARDKKRIISQSVKIFTSICPECGKTYVSGGETLTVTASKSAQPGSISVKGQLVDKYA